MNGYSPDEEYAATIITDKGEIELLLFNDIAPRYVRNFYELAQSGFYDGSPFHRVIADFMIQGGTNAGGENAAEFDDDFHPDMKHDKAGVLSMANRGFNTNTSQFFITHGPTPWLDPYQNGELKQCQVPGNSCHAVFGQVTSGQDVVDSIVQGDVIETIEIWVRDR